MKLDPQHNKQAIAKIPNRMTTSGYPVVQHQSMQFDLLKREIPVLFLKT
jgi:hypothetical protein